VFLQPITDEFHWSDSKLTGLMLVALLLAGLATPAIGRLVDRIGARPVALAGAVAFPAAIAALSRLSHTVPMACLLFGLAGLTAPALGAVAFNKALSAWFEGRRGIVLAMVGMGGAVGGFVIPQIVELLMHHVDWRGAYVGLGAVICVVTLPVLALFFHEPPARRIEIVDTGTGPHRIVVGTAAAEVFRSAPFWLLVGAVATNVFVGIGLQIHVIPLLTDRGLERDAAVNLSSYFPLGQVAGQLLAGWLLDRYDTPRIVVPFFVASLIGLLMLDYLGGQAMLVAAGLMLRVGVGAELSIAPYLLVRYFGLKSFGQVYGVLFLLSTLAAGAGVQTLSYCHDLTQSYRIALVVSEVLLALGVCLVSQLGPYLYPAHLTAGTDPHGPALKPVPVSAE
jgi:MFS family permease